LDGQILTNILQHVMPTNTFYHILVNKVVCDKERPHNKTVIVIAACTPVEREGRGESFLGPHDVWLASPSLKNTENVVPGGFFLT